MKSSYRHMMGQIALDEQARGRIAARLETAAKAPRRHVRPLRAVLLAACVCLALAGSVFAAQTFFGVEFWGANANRSSYKVSAGGLTSFTREAFGRQMAEDIRTAPDPDCTVYQAFGTWEELEAYMGVPLAYNPMLEEAALLRYPTDENDLSEGYEWYDGEDLGGRPLYRYDMLIRRVSGELLDGFIEAHSELDGVDIVQDVEFFGEDNVPATSFGMVLTYGGENDFRPEKYTMENGCEAQLVYRDAASDGTDLNCDAFFVSDGMLYHLHFSNLEGAPVDPALVQRVLDAYE